MTDLVAQTAVASEFSGYRRIGTICLRVALFTAVKTTTWLDRLGTLVLSMPIQKISKGTEGEDKMKVKSFIALTLPDHN